MHCEWVVLVVLVSFDEPVTGPSARSPEVLAARRRAAIPHAGVEESNGSDRDNGRAVDAAAIAP